jgi:hypothetical protein
VRWQKRGGWRRGFEEEEEEEEEENGAFSRR